MSGVMAAVPTILQVGGSILGAASANATGKAYRAAGEYEAKVREQQAGQERAAGQRKAQEQRRIGRLAESRALALAAASGGGASDPTVTNIIADLAGEGEYRALTAMYEGEERGRALESDAQMARFSGRAAQSAYRGKAVSSLLTGASALWERYGGIFDDDDEEAPPAPKRKPRREYY